MIIKVKVHPKSGRSEVVKISEGEFEVWLKKIPSKGKANAELIRLISKELGISSKAIRIKNPKSRIKIIEVIE